MEMISKPGKGGLAMIGKAMSFLLFGACVSVFGCRGSDKTWSAEARSPDEKFIASARTLEQSGFGTGSIGTAVYLNWAKGSQPKMLILAFSDGPAGPGGMSVEMNWLTPTHLELTYKGQRTLDFQAIRCAGIDITARDVSSERN